MNTTLRRIRGAIGNAALWSGAWTLASVLWIGWILGRGLILTPELVASTDWGAWPIWGAILRMTGFTAAVGAGTGIAFSTYLAANFRQKELEDLSSARVALGGGLVTLLVGLVVYLTLAAPSGLNFGDVLPLLSWGTLLGSGMGYASVAIGRRALPEPAGSEPKLGTPQARHGRSERPSNTRLKPTR